MSESPYIVNVTAQTFATEVIGKSNQVPVLVDFWAPWCAPCKTLLPVLTKLANDYQGQFILAKVNTDEQQQLAAQFGIRSIPTLKLFRNGRVVEETMGAQSESVFRGLIDRHRERPADKLRQQAIAAHAAGDLELAITLLQQAQELEPSYHQIFLDLAKVLIDMNKFEEVEQVLAQLPAKVQMEVEVNELKARLKFAAVAVKAPSVEALKERLAINPHDHLARYQLSARKVLNGEYEVAMDNLLELMRRDRQFEDGAAQKGLLAIFTLLGNQGPVVTRYRGKMSSLLY